MGDGKEVSVTGKQPNSKMCFVCGLKNSFGLKSRFYELENGEVMAVFQPQEEHQGYPGRLHGGLAAAILDETIGRAVMLGASNKIWGVTLDFSMRLRKPIPLDKEIRVIGRIVSENKRTFEGTGEILLEDGKVGIEATGRYFKMDIEKIADFDEAEQEWHVVRDPNDPEVVAL